MLGVPYLCSMRGKKKSLKGLQKEKCLQRKGLQKPALSAEISSIGKKKGLHQNRSPKNGLHKDVYKKCLQK